MTQEVRQPVVCVLGHIDSGKTSILDTIRGTSVQKREAGGITQHIGASFFPASTIEEICGPLLKKLGITKLNIPGLLIIDTPGHAAFMNLRSRGGAVADIAILVVDILDGIQVQTRESINILKARKTPFLVADNKIDRISGWKSQDTNSFLESFSLQDPFVQRAVDDKIYELMGEFSSLNYKSDRFDRIDDFTKTIAIVPTSAKENIGIPELLMVLAGLSQQYLKDRIKVSKGNAKGTILEVKEEPGLGITLDTIIYEGIIKKDDKIVVGGAEDAIVTRIRALLLPKPLDEIRDPREKFVQVDRISAAAGVKIVGPNLDDVMAGAPLRGVSDESEIPNVIEDVQSEISRIKIDVDKSGVILKADTLGSLEAIVDFFKDEDIPIRIADVGAISKRDIIEASVVKESDPLRAVILSFNTKLLPDAKEEAETLEIPIFENKIIYRLVEDYKEWYLNKKEELKKLQLKDVTQPGKVKVLRGFIFRRTDPAIVGVKVLTGRVKPKNRLISGEGKMVGLIREVQDKGQNIDLANSGQEVAISIRGATVGRTFKEEDELLVDVPEHHFKILKNKFWDELPFEEQELLEELAKIKRKAKSYWGM
ncbi:MAG: translation initiation factor IF-2 [Candidatus Helarchaeota archaeon]|nr:translation initiation factor IF-2 [Candidatus Helarchaeota archaeon]